MQQKPNSDWIHLAPYQAIVLCCIWFCIPLRLGAQNLVPNPSFEVYFPCPPPWVGGMGALEAIPWWSIGGTADYFNACSAPLIRGVPYNFQGYQPARTGDGYTGVYSTTLVGDYREYIHVELLEPLVAGQCYFLEAWINLSNTSCPADRFGILLSEDYPDPIQGANPQVEWSGGYISDTLGWTSVSGYYTAYGNEAFITIGNFRLDSETQMDPACSGPSAFAYYYIDDVLVEAQSPTEIPLPLGPPVVACDIYEIDPQGDPDAIYQWSTGDVSPTLTVTTSGTYSVTISYDCLEAVGDVDVTILHPLQVDLGPDQVVICEGDQYEISLDPNSGTYEWDDGSTDPDYTITTAGTYQVTLDDGCTLSTDEISIITAEAPQAFTLGPDAVLCNGEPLLIEFDPLAGDFLWQDGSTMSAITIQEAGTYALTISNQCGAQDDELEVIEMFTPAVSLGPDTTILCNSEVIYFAFDTLIGDYVWQDGSIESMYTISQSGLYSVSVSNFCGSAADSMEVMQYLQPTVDLGADLQGCPGDTFLLNGGLNMGGYTWQDGSSALDFHVVTSGVYSLEVLNPCGSDADTVSISFAPVLITPDLGPDINLCPGEQLVLSVPASASAVLWNDMSTADTLLVTTGGTYSVQVSTVCAVFADTIVVSGNNNPPLVQLPADFALCQGDTTILDAGIAGVSYVWNDGSVNATLAVSAPGIYSVTVSNSCGASMDSVSIAAGGLPPLVSLGADTSLCLGDTILLFPVAEHVDAWLWQDGSVASFYQVTSPGMIYVTGSNSCSDAFDTLLISISPPPPLFSLGQDTALCPGESLTLTIAISNVDILWSDGSMSDQLVVTDSTVVLATVSNICGATTDSLSVTVLPEIPQFDLGPDQTICPGEEVIFSPGITGVSYLWQDGSTDTQYQALQGGEYILVISNACGSATDTIVLTESTVGPQVDLGPDIVACQGDIVTISAGISGVQYQWQDGSSGDEFIVTAPGVYSLMVSNACGSDLDTIVFSFLNPPASQDLGPDTVLCEGTQLILIANADPGTSFSWQDMSSGSSFNVMVPGLYYLTTMNQCGSASDSIAVEFLAGPDPFDLGPDTTLCPGQSLVLSPPSVGYDILWQDGSVMADQLVIDAGIYSLQLSNVCGTAIDSLLVTINTEKPELNFEPEMLWCPGEQLVLDALQPFEATYAWSTGAVTPTIIVASPGLYEVEVMTSCYTVEGQTALIPLEDCSDGSQFYFPNVFSPDGNGINDFFTISTDMPQSIISMEGKIYDRWGNLVYSSTGNTFVWDGRFEGSMINPGVYVYQVHIRWIELAGVVEQNFYGDLTVIR